MTEFITDMDARQAACDRAELIAETAEPGSAQAKAAAAVLYAYRHDGIMTAEEVAAMETDETVESIGGGFYEAANGTVIYSPDA